MRQTKTERLEQLIFEVARKLESGRMNKAELEALATTISTQFNEHAKIAQLCTPPDGTIWRMIPNREKHISKGISRLHARTRCAHRTASNLGCRPHGHQQAPHPHLLVGSKDFAGEVQSVHPPIQSNGFFGMPGRRWGDVFRG